MVASRKRFAREEGAVQHLPSLARDRDIRPVGALDEICLLARAPAGLSRQWRSLDHGGAGWFGELPWSGWIPWRMSGATPTGGSVAACLKSWMLIIKLQANHMQLSDT